MDHRLLQFSRYGLLLPIDSPYLLTLADIEAQFGQLTHARRNVFEGLQRGVNNLFDAGVERVALGGSFISTKREPADADIAWWYSPDIDWQRLDPVFQSSERRGARGKYLLDQKVDGLEDVPYEWSHEFFLRFNHRMPLGHQSVGIVLIVTGESR